jgi:hypothetical protein
LHTTRFAGGGNGFVRAGKRHTNSLGKQRRAAKI